MVVNNPMKQMSDDYDTLNWYKDFINRVAKRKLFNTGGVKKIFKSGRSKQEKILCQVCFEEKINVVLLPCRHRILCRSCCQRCKRCPICRIYIVQRLCVDEV